MSQVLRPMDRAALIDEELHDLKLRYELLEGDRKAYYETSQWTIRQNKDLIAELRQKNKELRESMSKLKKQETDAATSRYHMTEIEKMEQRICEYHKRHDELQAVLRQKQSQLSFMHDQVNEFQRNLAASTVTQQAIETPYAKEIRMLENRLDKALIKYNEAQSVRRTYEQIVKRLQDERLSFDHEIAHFERTLKAKRSEVAELELMSRDAHHAKEVAKAELGRFEQQISEERKQREKELQARRDLVRAKKDDNALNPELQKLQIEEPETQQQRGNDATKEHVDEQREKRVREYEEAMRTIKEATGVSNIHEVLQKFQAQGDTHSHLLQLQAQYEARIEELKKRRAQIQRQYDDLKYTGESKQAHARQLMDDLTNHLEVASVRADEVKRKYERLAKILLQTKTGVQHLCEKLEMVQLPGQQQSHSVHQSIPVMGGDDTQQQPAPAPASVSDDQLVSTLGVCAAKLELLHQAVKDKEIPQEHSDEKLLQFTQTVLPQHNCRVKLRPTEFEKNIESEGEENDDEAGEVPDRDTLKKYTNQMLNARQKVKQPKKKGKKKTLQEDKDE